MFCWRPLRCLGECTLCVCVNKTKEIFVTGRVGRGEKAAKTGEYLEREMRRRQRNMGDWRNQLWSRHPPENKRLTCEDPGSSRHKEAGGRFGKSKNGGRGENQAIHPFLGTWTQSESMITHLKKKKKNILCHNPSVSFCYSCSVTEAGPECLNRRQQRLGSMQPQTRLLQAVWAVLDS